MLTVEQLSVKFHTSDRLSVDNLSFEVQEGEILGIVGESGSGKTVTAMSVAGLLPRDLCDCTGKIYLDGIEILHAKRNALRRIQGKDIGVVFQDPMSSFDPLMKVGRQVGEALSIHEILSSGETENRVLKALTDAELPNPKEIAQKYPYELSGGMLQRALIAAALITKPKLLILDEPTTALDVTTQLSILKLIKRINRENGTTMLFISHDLTIIRRLCKRVVVMYRGKRAEYGETEQIFTAPKDDYTQRLISALPNDMYGRDNHGDR